MKPRFLAAAALAMALPLFAQTPYLVRDINNGPAAQELYPSYPNSITLDGTTLYFTALTAGYELFRYTGATAELVKDINPSGSSSPGPLIRVGNSMLFSATSSAGRELWQTDGTTAGTRLLKDFYPNGSGDVFVMFKVGTRAILTATDPVNGTGLWASDGTETGTTLLADLSRGATVLSPHARMLGQRVYVAHEHGLWVTDGTAAGTTQLVTGESVITGAIGMTLLFRTIDPQYGSELWKTDGTVAGTTLVKDIVPGSAGSAPSSRSSSAAAAPTSALFFAHGGTDVELWTTNGTTAGTTKVRAFPEHTAEWTRYGPPFLMYALGAWWFSTPDGMWRSDGTNAGTTLFSTERASTYATAFSKLYFQAESGGLWSTDGTAAGTVLVKALRRAPVIRAMYLLGGKLYFPADDGTAGEELWVSDGTAAGTRLLVNINPEPPPVPQSSNPSLLLEGGSSIHFTANGDSARPLQLWRSDGTSGGTLEVSAFASRGEVQALASWNGAAFYERVQSTTARTPVEVWRSDASGLTQVAALEAEVAQAIGTPNALLLSERGGRVWVIGAGPEPVRLTDSAGTALLVRSRFAAAGGRVYFVAEASGQSSLYVTDGTSATTTVAIPSFTYTSIWGALGTIFFDRDGALYRLGNSSDPVIRVMGQQYVSVREMVTSGRYAYFLSGNALWRTDGTEAGTIVLTSNLRSNVVAARGLVFFAQENASGTELWRTDGTAAGTVMVTDINPGAGSAYPNELFVADDTVWFSAYTPATSFELWRSDGTAAGTFMVADLNPGESPSQPGSFGMAGRRLYFAAASPTMGRELWALPLAASVITVADVTVREGDAGTSVARFVFTRSGSTSGPATVNYATAPLTATAGTDYVTKTGMVSFAAGQTTQYVDVTVNGDNAFEVSSETFALELSAPAGASLTRSAAIATIEEDDVRANLSLTWTGFAFVVTNAGPSTAREVVLTVAPSPATGSCSRGCAYNLGSIAPGGTGTLNYIPRPASSLVFDGNTPPVTTVTAFVTSAVADPGMTDNHHIRSHVGRLSLPPFLVAGTTASAAYYGYQAEQVTPTSSATNVTFTPATFSHAGGASVSPVTVRAEPGAGTAVITVGQDSGRIRIAAAGETVKLDVGVAIEQDTYVSYGAPVKIKATVAGYRAGSGSGASPTGTLTLLNGETELETLTLDATSAASFTRSDLPPGTYTWRFRYSGDANFNSAFVTAPYNTTVGNNPATASMALAHTSCNTVQGTVTVSNANPRSTAAPTGSVRMTVNGVDAGTFALTPVGGLESRATVSVRVSPGGNVEVKATYVPTGYFGPASTVEYYDVQACPIVLDARGNATNVSLTWTAHNGPAPIIYDVFRSTGTLTFTGIGSTSSLSFVDTKVLPNKTYLYSVVARDGGGAYSLFSNTDLASTMAFTDESLVPKVTRVKTAHVTELRAAINNARAMAGLQAFAFSAAPTSGALIRATHITELRTALGPVFTAMNLPQPVYTDPTLPAGSPIKAAHIQDVRNALR